MADSEASVNIDKMMNEAKDSLNMAADFVRDVKASIESLANLQPAVIPDGWDPSDSGTQELSQLQFSVAGGPIRITRSDLGYDPVGFAIAAPTMGAMASVNSASISAVGVPVPTLTIPVAPTAVMPVLPIAPNIQDIVVPNEPVVALPALPVLVDPSIPVFSGVNMPAFGADTPVIAIPEPTLPQAWSEAFYHPEGSLEAMLWAVSILNLGGTMLTANDETRLLQAAKDGAVVGINNNATDIGRRFRQHGYQLPVGSELAANRKLARDLALAESEASRTWSLRLAEMAIDAKKTAISSALKYAEIALPYVAGMQERMLKYGIHIADWAVSVYNAKIDAAKLEWQGYEAESRVFDTLVRAELTKVEVFGKEVEAAKALIETNDSKVRVYTAQIEAAKAIYGMFESRMRGAELQAKIQELQFGIFREKISAYSTQVAAETAKFNMYGEQLRGEKLKVDIYATRVDAAKAMAMVNKERADVNLSEQRNAIDKYRAEADLWAKRGNSYFEELTKTHDRHRLYIENQKMYDEQWRSALGGWGDYARLWQTKTEREVRHYEVMANRDLEVAKLEQGLDLARLKTIAETDSLLVHTFMNHAAALVAGVVATVSHSSSS